MAGQIVRELVTVWGFDVDLKALKQLDSGIEGIKSKLKDAGIAIIGTSLAIGALLNEAGKQEQVEVAFETMIGDAERARVALQELQEFATRTPFTLPGVEQNAKLLLGMGIELDSLLPTLKALGDVSAGLSVPLGRIALNFGQIKTQGKLTGRELRDFAVAGVPLLDELAKQLGKTKAEVTGLVSVGSIGFDEVEKAFISMSSEGGKFNNLMAKQSETLLGMISNIKDIGTLFAREIGKELLPTAKDVLKTFVAWFRENEKFIKSEAITFFKNLADLLGNMVSFMLTFAKAIRGASTAFGGFNNVLNITMDIFAAITALGMLHAVGLLTQGIIGLAVAWRTMGNAALFAQAKMALIPLTIGAIVAAIALIAEDILVFTQGGDSVFGRMLAGLDIFFARMKEKFGVFGTIGNFLIGAVLAPIRTIVNAFRVVGDIIDMIMGKVSAIQGITNILGRIGNTLGFGTTDSFTNALGLGENVNLAAEQQKQFNASAVPGLGGAPGPTAAQNVDQKNEIKIDLNVEGMDPESAKDLVNDTLFGELDVMLRGTLRDGGSQIER